MPPAIAALRVEEDTDDFVTIAFEGWLVEDAVASADVLQVDMVVQWLVVCTGTGTSVELPVFDTLCVL